MRENIRVYLIEEVHDVNGHRVYYRKRRSHSFTQQFLLLLSNEANHIYGTDPAGFNLTDTAGAAQAMMSTTMTTKYLWSTEAAAGTITYGLVFGTGTNAEAATDYALQTAIAEGAGAGQLNYGATGVVTATQASGITSFTIARAAGNNSGGQITVQEVAWYITTRDTGNTQRYFCMLRDLTGGTAVGNGQTYTGTYTIQTTI